MIIDQILQEAQNYEGMFNDILKLNADPRLRHQITQDIDWARKTLRKNDRIVWFLRWVKVWLISTTTGSGVAAAASPGALQQQNRRLGTPPGQDDLVPSPALKQQLEHFLSLPVPEIQNYVFRAESPRGLFDLFAKYEAAWRQRIEEERSLITPEDDDEILIGFPDGFAWWLLPRGGCPVEAEAMGHCGNVPSERPGDRILSLRRKVRRGDVERWYPVATFILDADGQLGEMKGRGNDKPAPKYHPYIVELLRHHIIGGVKGGGYMPENNFSMGDLDPQTRDLVRFAAAIAQAIDKDLVWIAIVATFAAGLAFWLIGRERQWLVAELRPEVASGLLTQQEFYVLTSSLRRARVRLSALTSRGWLAYRRLGRFFQAATDLAFKKHELSAFGEERGNSAEIVRLRAQVQQLRAEGL